MSMPDKLILETQADPECIASDGKVFIEIDGIRKQLKRVRSLTVRADDRGVIEADLTVYMANSWIEVAITRANADAILAVEHGRQLAFLDSHDAVAIRELREELRNDWEGHEGHDQRGLAALDKLIAELDRREKT